MVSFKTIGVAVAGAGAIPFGSAMARRKRKKVGNHLFLFATTIII
jgi:hypothetical protein